MSQGKLEWDKHICKQCFDLGHFGANRLYVQYKQNVHVIFHIPSDIPISDWTQVNMWKLDREGHYGTLWRGLHGFIYQARKACTIKM